MLEISNVMDPKHLYGDKITGLVPTNICTVPYVLPRPPESKFHWHILESSPAVKRHLSAIKHLNKFLNLSVKVSLNNSKCQLFYKIDYSIY
jgi:hypothetical protein